MKLKGEMMQLTGDTNIPALPMTEAEVNHLRLTICNHVDSFDQRLSKLSDSIRIGHGRN